MIHVERVTSDRDGARSFALRLFWLQKRQAVTVLEGWDIEETESKARKLLNKGYSQAAGLK